VSGTWYLVADNDEADEWGLTIVSTQPIFHRAAAEELIVRASKGLTLGHSKIGLQAPDGTVVWLYQAVEGEDVWEPYVPPPLPPAWSARLYRGEELMASQEITLPPAMNGSITVTHTFAITEN
jgi:hypothetical protein